MSSPIKPTQFAFRIQSILFATSVVLFFGCENSSVAENSNMVLTTPSVQPKVQETQSPKTAGNSKPVKQTPVEQAADKPEQAPKKTNQIEPEKKTTGDRVTVKKEPLLTRNGKTYNPNQLHKNQTLLVLAAQTDIRARLILSPFRTIIDDEQFEVAYDIAMAHDQQFNELLRERASVLETAFDGQNTGDKLTDIKMRTADLLIKARRKIQQTVLSAEQRAAAIKLWQEWIDLEKEAQAAQDKAKAAAQDKATKANHAQPNQSDAPEDSGKEAKQ